MKKRFESFYKNLNAVPDAISVFSEIEKLYSIPQRFYHNLEHIGNCLAEFDKIKDRIKDKYEFEFALWLHDCVYDTRSSDNEEKSGKIATEIIMDSGLSKGFVKKVYDFIIATKHNKSTDDSDTKYLIDIDLAILGSSADSYNLYRANIRKEYAWVNNIDFSNGRKKALESFLNRERIYYTDYFYEKYEIAARTNLKEEIRALDDL